MEHNDVKLEDLYDTIKGMSPKERQILIDTFIHEASMLAFSLRKTFSIGKAEDKRYYLECRKIIK